jgi:glycosyltransferase involved in cell wall biosynthesis
MGAGRPRILVTLPDLAWPLHSGKRRRLASAVRGLAGVGTLDVAVLFADTGPGDSPVPPAVDLAAWGYLPPDPQPVARTAVRSLTQFVPWQIAVQPWPRAVELVSSWGPPYDLVWFGCLDHAVSLSSQRWAPRVLVDCDDVETAKLQRFLAVPPASRRPDRDRVQRRIEVPMWARVQQRVLRGADRVFVCSELDRQRLAGSGPVDKIAVLPNTYPDVVPLARVPAGTCTVVMIADYANDANADAAHVAVEQVLPRLRARCADAVVRLVGRKVERVAELAGQPGVELVGEIAGEQVSAELRRAHAVLVPLRFAGGTRLKIIEALAYGVPVVSTSAGAEGLAVLDGVHALIADDPGALASAVLRLVDEPQLAARLTVAGRELYEARYRPDAAEAVVRAAVRDVLGLGAPPADQQGGVELADIASQP